jgi:hypothetical protein
VRFDAEELTRIVSSDTVDAVLEEAAAKRFTELMKLAHHEWLSFDDFARDLR